MTKYLGLDLGSKTLGISTSNGYIAAPYKTIRFADYKFQPVVNEIIEICLEKKYTDLVIGYPLNMDDSLGPKTKMIDDFIVLIKNHSKFNQIKLKIHKVDERLTTQMAHDYMLKADLSRKKRKAKKDTLAAQIILNSFLNEINKC